MTGKIKYLLILLFATSIADLSAQNTQVLYYMNLPQNHLLNPAIRPTNKLYIGLPVISGINLNVNNNFVNFSDVFMKGQPNDSVLSFLHPDYNIDDFLAKIKEKSSIEPEATVQLFGLGFSIGGNGYIFLDINERVDGNVVFPGDLFKLAFKGNEPFVGKTIDLSSLRADMKYYREIGLGYSRDITNKLRIGVKGKLLFGIAAASIDNKALGITVNPDYSHTLDADLTVNISAPLTVYSDVNHKVDSLVVDKDRFDTRSGIVDFVSGKKNIGLGLDIGATYNITDKLMVSAAITDIGFIRWKKDLTNLASKNTFEFSGLNMLDVINGTKTIDEVGQEMLDSLKNAFKLTASNTAFTTFLPFGVTVGGSYYVTERFSVGLLSYSRFIGKQVREALTLSANVNLGNSFSTSLSYTAANSRFDNIGAGLAFRPGMFQFYILTDRIPITWNKIKNEDSTIPLPSSWNTINLRLGMNLVFGNNVKKKSDRPMILVE